MTVWTDDRIERLRNLWEGGATSAAIAQELDVPRNAVIGKAHRLGLTTRGNPVETKESRFERMVDLIADAPLGQPLPLDNAAKQVGLMSQTARKMWRELMQRRGEQYR